MGVYIKGMEMPITCNECRVFEAANCYRFRDIKFTKERHQNCPLAEVKTPHGRLVDADQVVTAIYYDDQHEEWDCKTKTVGEVLASCVEEEVKPVIEAEE